MKFLKVSQSVNYIETICLNRPEKHHALNITMIKELIQTFKRVFEDDAIKGILLKAPGRVFCAGADLNEMHHNTDKLIDQIVQLIRVLQQKNKPMYIALTGDVYGGGSILLSFADAIIAAESSRIIMPEIQSDIWPVFLLRLLKKHLPQGLLINMAMNAKPLSAVKAHNLGWFSDIETNIDQVEVTSWSLLKAYCKRPQPTLKAIYQCYREVFMSHIDEQALLSLGEKLKALIRIKQVSISDD